MARKGDKPTEGPGFEASPGHKVYINPATGQPYSEHMQRIIEKNLDDRRDVGQPSKRAQAVMACKALGRKLPAFWEDKK